jgi:hypothetical protein
MTNKNNLSSWERATAVLKKPNNSTSIQQGKKRKLEPDYDNHDDEDEEYDSEMDDFIDDDDDDGNQKANGKNKNYSKEIRKIFKYNPDRYKNDDDDPNMEASYHDIMREERKR